MSWLLKMIHRFFCEQFHSETIYFLPNYSCQPSHCPPSLPLRGHVGQEDADRPVLAGTAGTLLTHRGQGILLRWPWLSVFQASTLLAVSVLLAQPAELPHKQSYQWQPAAAEFPSGSLWQLVGGYLGLTVTLTAWLHIGGPLISELLTLAELMAG